MMIRIVYHYFSRCGAHLQVLLSLSCRPPRRSITVDAHNPPYEEVLVGMRWVSSPSIVVSSPLPPHPVSHRRLAGAGAGSVIPSLPCRRRQAAPAIPPYK